MQYWLMKSEPNCYSIDDLKRDKITHWDGVRNYQARNMMRDQMKCKDQVFFYHSNAKPTGIVGIAEVVKEATTTSPPWIQTATTPTPKALQRTPAGIWSM